jgi:hypothetical protein
MSMQAWFGRILLTAFSVLAVGAAVSAADPPAAGDKDLLDEARRRDEVAQQKAESDFRAALIEMSKLEDVNPARAVDGLKHMLAVLEEDMVIKPAKRDAWKRVLKDRIRVAEAVADRAAKGATDATVREAKKDERRVKEEQKAREEEMLKRDLETVRRLQKDGRDDEAAKLAGDLARRYPDRPAASASGQINSRAKAVKEYRLVRDEMANGWTLALNDVHKSAVLPKDPDYNFPSPEKWREITKMRTKSQATEREKEILRALDSPMTLKFEGSTLESVIDYLQTLTGLTIVLDKNTLDAVGASYDTPITMNVRKVSLRTVLRKLFGEIPGGNLTYIVERETIHVLTHEEAKKKLTVRTYYLGDLAAVADMSLPPLYNAVTMAANVRSIIETIVGTVEPDSWKVNNPDASGTIYFDPRTLTLIVKQSAEVHYMLGGFGR